jgi:hypothetical protein
MGEVNECNADVTTVKASTAIRPVICRKVALLRVCRSDVEYNDVVPPKGMGE